VSARSPKQLHRWLALFALVFGVPAVSNLAIEALEIVLGAECAADDCASGSDTSCPESCAHCTCCVHANAVPSLAFAPPVQPAPRAIALAVGGDAVHAAGFHSTPFRPPAA
jgi:hypothetical protein